MIKSFGENVILETLNDDQLFGGKKLSHKQNVLYMLSLLVIDFVFALSEPIFEYSVSSINRIYCNTEPSNIFTMCLL